MNKYNKWEYDAWDDVLTKIKFPIIAKDVTLQNPKEIRSLGQLLRHATSHTEIKRETKEFEFTHGGDEGCIYISTPEILKMLKERRSMPGGCLITHDTLKNIKKETGKEYVATYTYIFRDENRHYKSNIIRSTKGRMQGLFILHIYEKEEK